METDEELPEPCQATIPPKSGYVFRRKWVTEAVRALSRGIVQDKAFERMPILADALEEAGCNDERMLAHCRAAVPHDTRCWVLHLTFEPLLRKRSWEDRPSRGSPRDPAIRVPNVPFLTNEATFDSYHATLSRPRSTAVDRSAGAGPPELPPRPTVRTRLRGVVEWVGGAAVVLLVLFVVLFLIAVFLGKPQPDWQGVKKAEGVRPPLAVAAVC